ncbi:GntR family transcriptional regulator [Frigidibacter sp. MR17.24]|uniref:GntR family transcriptional regulator n=1 Tax=Frigidibacter sp. MR17.24 TaxID=3127345 RepID=UPI003012D4E4
MTQSATPAQPGAQSGVQSGTLPATAGQPRYMVLAQHLIDEIAAGTYPVGSLLPTEFELCARFAVSRHTVREAIRRLADLGMVTRQPGVGTRVQAPKATSRYVHASEGIGDLFRYVQDVNLVIRDAREVIADEALAELLGCRPGQAWLRVLGERHVAGEDRPIALAEVYIAWPYRQVIAGVTEPKTPIYAMIEAAHGIVASEVHQQVSAVLLDDRAAEAFGTEPGAAGLRVERRYLTMTGELFELAVNLHPGNRFSHSMVLHRETQTVPTLVPKP